MRTSTKLIFAGAAALIVGTKLHVMYVANEAEKNITAHRYTTCAAWLNASNAESPLDKKLVAQYTEASIRLNPYFFINEFNNQTLAFKKEISRSRSSAESTMSQEMTRCEDLFKRENNY